MARRTGIRLTLVAAVLGAGFFLVGGCETMRKVRFGIRSYLRPGPDYEALEADRARHGEAGGSAESPPPEAMAPAYWTDFRGPGRLGIYAERDLDLDWPEGGPPLVWRQPVGPGYGSFTVALGLAFTLEQRRDEEAVVAYEVATGREAWLTTYPALFDEAMSGVGPRSTPVFADDTVYSHGATGTLVALDARTGEERWRRDVLADTRADPLEYGFSASPLVRGELLVVGGAAPREGGSGVIAYDRGDGTPVWTAVTEPMGYTSPVLLDLAGRPQLVVFSAERAIALDPDTGAELWSHPFRVTNGLVCSQPVRIDDQHLLLSAGYGKGAELLRIQAGAEGLGVERVWRNPRLKNRYNSSVLHDGYVYGLDEGRLACIEPLTGERQWKGPVFGYGQTILVGDEILIVTEDGEVARVAADPEAFRELGRFEAIEGMTLNVPALADGLLLVRNHDQMACFDLDAVTSPRD